jgi:ribonuclease III
MSLDALQEALGHRFSDQGLLVLALTHASYAHENDVPDNERLEFLGDAVLQAATSELLFRKLPDADEGMLSQLRSSLVDARSLAEVARTLGLGALIRLGVGEEANGGRDNGSVLSDATEAVLGAVFLDAGFEVVRPIVKGWFEGRADRPAARTKHPKTALQERTQQLHQAIPEYVELARTGPDHAPQVTVAVRLDGRELASATAGSRKEAERLAAEQVLGRLEP